MKIKSRMGKGETKASTAKIAIWYVVGNMFVKGIGMLTTPIFTRLLSQTEYGVFSNITSWESVITTIVTLDFAASIARAKYDFGERMHEFIASILVASNVITLIAYGIVECNPTYFEQLFMTDMMYIRMLFVYLLFMPAFTFLQINHQIHHKYKFFLILSVGSAVIRTLISVLLVIGLENRLFGRMIGYFVPITLCNIVLWLYIVIRARRVSWKCIVYASKISLPLIPHALSGVILGSVDRIMITNFCGAATTAVYSVAYSVSMFASLIWASMNDAWAPWLFDRLYEKNNDSIRKNSNKYIGVFLLLVFGVLLVTPEIIWVLGGDAYYEARYIMPAIILGIVFQFMYSLYVNIEMYMKKTFNISIGTMLAAVLNLVLNWMFIPRYGYIAAAYTTTIGYMALFVFHYIIVKKSIKEFANVYEEKWVFGGILFMAIASIIAIFLYQYNVIRYIILLIYVVLLLIGVYKNKDVILKLLGK